MGVLFLSDGDLQMISFRWPLAQVQLDKGRLLSKIVTWCSEHGESSGEDSGLEGARKNPYRHMKRRKLSPLVETKLKRKLSDSDVQRVSSLRCCKFRCCQSFSWNDTLALRRKFYGSTFELYREIAYAVQGQLHSLPERRKKFLTLSGREVCENAWFMAFLERHTISTRLQLLPVGSTECMGTPESLGRDHIQFRLRPILRLLSKRT